MPYAYNPNSLPQTGTFSAVEFPLCRYAGATLCRKIVSASCSSRTSGSSLLWRPRMAGAYPTAPHHWLICRRLRGVPTMAFAEDCPHPGPAPDGTPVERCIRFNGLPDDHPLRSSPDTLNLDPELSHVIAELLRLLHPGHPGPVDNTGAAGPASGGSSDGWSSNILPGIGNRPIAER